jgi:Carboxypeptidase regulatory-like domain
MFRKRPPAADRFRPLLRGFLCFLLAAIPVSGQNSAGSVFGRVLDPSGQAVPDTLIRVIDTGTGLGRTSRTDSGGAYRVTALPVGNYTLKASAPGFAELVRSVEVTAGSSTYVDFRLEINPSHTTVTALSTVPLLEYQANAVTGIISRPQMQDLPLNGRSSLQLAVQAVRYRR